MAWIYRNSSLFLLFYTPFPIKSSVKCRTIQQGLPHLHQSLAVCCLVLIKFRHASLVNSSTNERKPKQISHEPTDNIVPTSIGYDWYDSTRFDIFYIKRPQYFELNIFQIWLYYTKSNWPALRKGILDKLEYFQISYLHI